jgi:MFS family permease
VVAGYYSANGQLYRFAAAELTDISLRDKAISWVLAGGLLGAIIGPNLATWTHHLFSTPFLGAYLSLAIAAIFGLLLMQFIKFPPIQVILNPLPGRSVIELLKQPVFLVAVIGASLGYGVMNLLMAATPLAMQVCKLPFSDTALVLEWHVIGMFAPGFFTGSLIKRFGALKIMGVGVALNFLCIFIALSGTDLKEFLVALCILGIGWNFLFTGSTSLAIKAYRPEEKDKAQATINFFVFSVMAVSSFSSGALLTSQGWNWLNWGSVFPLILIFVALVWLGLKTTFQKTA